MADKPEKKEPAVGKRTHPAEPVIVMFFVAIILSAILFRLGNFSGDETSTGFLYTLWFFVSGRTSWDMLVASTGIESLPAVLSFLKVLSYAFSIFLLGVIITTYRKYGRVMHKIMEPVEEHHGAGHHGVAHGFAHDTEKRVNPKWEKVLEHLNSPNASDWRLAILEADIMLAEILDKMGYHGTTIGDKLKSIEPSDFDTLDEAWEAHKIRNAIAHEGSDFTLNKPEAERVIRLFKKVFEEFKFI